MEAQKRNILIKFNLLIILLLVLRGSYLKTHCYGFIHIIFSQEFSSLGFYICSYIHVVTGGWYLFILYLTGDICAV